MATVQELHNVIQGLQLQVQQLELRENNRADQIREMVEATAQAAAQAAAAAVAAAPQQQHGPPVQQPEAGENAAEKRFNNAARALSSVPKFDGKENWRTFESSYLTWYRINRIDRMDEEFQKRSLLSSMRGQAVEMTRPYAENTETYRNCATLNAYVDAMRAVFLPPEESELARTEFKIRKQGRKEDISTYLSAKIALWQLAYPADQRSFSTLMDETITGICNRIVKRHLRYAVINNENELRRHAIRCVAAERQCYREGTAESTTLDGLAATTRLVEQRNNDDDMEWDDEVRAKFDGDCNKCGKYGHRASNCWKDKPRKQQSDQKQQVKCYGCDRLGHVRTECRATHKLNGDKIVRKDQGGDKKKAGKAEKGKGRMRKAEEVTDNEDEDEEEKEEDDFLEQSGDSEQDE